MRGFHFYSGGRDSGVGCALFFILIIFAPVLSKIFSIISWLLENIKLVIFIGAVLGVIIFIGKLTRNIDNEEIEEGYIKCKGGCGNIVEERLECCDDCLDKLIFND